MSQIISPFIRYCMALGVVPSNYEDNLTVIECLNFLIKFLNDTVIPAFNENDEHVEEIKKQIEVLQKYVDSYFDSLDIQTEVDHKLDDMAKAGTLADIINQEIFNNLNNKITNLELENRNKKYMLALFLDTAERQSEQYVTELMTYGANAGFGSCQMLIHIQSDGTLLEDKTKFSMYNTIANDLKIPIKSVKFHGSRNSVRYQENILDCLSYFPDAETVFVMNEQGDYIYTDGLGYPSIIKNQYPNIKKVGFTVSYSRGFYNMNGFNITPSQWNQVASVYDILGINVYPSCGSYSDAKNVDYEKIKSSFNLPPFVLKWFKDLWITESGVLPYWQMLELPESWNVSLLTDTTKDTTPQKLFFKALNESDIAKRADKIIPWYTESGMSDENHELFKILKSIIKGE